MFRKYLLFLILALLPVFTMVACDEEDDCGFGAVFCGDDGR